MKLYIVRHGETEWNAANRLQGHLNSPLTRNGIRDAQLLADKLQDITFDSIISSPSGRTLHTAEILKGKRTLKIIQDERLLEINHGNWQGKTLEEIKVLEPDHFETYINYPHLFQPTDNQGESLYDVLDRVQDFLNEMENASESGTHLIVTHGVVVKILQMIGKRSSMERIWEPPRIDGTSVTIMEIKNGYRKLLIEGDISHKEIN